MTGLSDLFTEQPDPSGPMPFITAGAALLLIVLSAPWRWARTVITIVHEAGHALIAVLAGRRLQGIRVHSDTSGVTVSRGRATGPGMVLTTLVGYPASALLGVAFAALLAANRITALFAVAALLLIGVLVMTRNMYGFVAVLVTAVMLSVVIFIAGPAIQSWFVYFITWFLLLGAVRPIIELQIKRRRGKARDSDVDQLARLTGLPAVLWVLMMAVIVSCCVFVGGSWLLEPALQV